MIKIENVSKTYKHRRGAKVEALDGITFDLPDKGMVFILGPSGSGKSTLLNILGGLDDFDGGDVVFKGKNFKNFKEHDRNAYRNSVCGFVFQEYCLIPELNVTDNVKITAQLKGAKNAAETAEKALNLVGLQGFAGRKVTELSGGQSQRVAIARAIAKNPEIIFADEPTGALDETTGKDILTLLKGLSRDRLVIAVSHERKFAEEFGDRVIELADGKIKSDSDGSYRDEPCRTGSARAEELSSPKLPLKTALRLGCGNLLRRPARTVITILLSAAAFALTGLTVSAGVE